MKQIGTDVIIYVNKKIMLRIGYQFDHILPTGISASMHLYSNTWVFIGILINLK